jgi:hypothetical protein
MAFSIEAVLDHDASWVPKRLSKTVSEGEFWFTGETPKDFGEFSVNVLAELGLSHLRGPAVFGHLHVRR